MVKPRLGWILLVAGVVLVVGGAIIVGYVRAGNQYGQITLSAAEFDFGTISSAEPVQQVFQIVNTGIGDLQITGVSTSCGCTTAEVEDQLLSPGEATDLTVTYDPQVHNGQTGAFMRVVYVRSNDPKSAETTLVIRVMVADS